MSGESSDAVPLNPPKMAKQNIVVVGGGGLGSQLARTLSSKLDSSRFDLILISASDRYYHNPALIRSAVTSEGALDENAVIPYDSLFNNGPGKLLVGKVAAIEKNGEKGSGGVVVLQGGEKVAFRYLVVATGSIWEGPLATLGKSSKEYVATTREWRSLIQKAQSIVLVGGGSIGLGMSFLILDVCFLLNSSRLEFAGEIRDLYPVRCRVHINATHPLMKHNSTEQEDHHRPCWFAPRKRYVPRQVQERRPKALASTRHRVRARRPRRCR